MMMRISAKIMTTMTLTKMILTTMTLTRMMLTKMIRTKMILTNMVLTKMVLTKMVLTKMISTEILQLMLTIICDKEQEGDDEDNVGSKICSDVDIDKVGVEAFSYSIRYLKHLLKSGGFGSSQQ